MARYNVNEDTITWELELPDGSPYYLHWPRIDFPAAMLGGNREDHPELPPKLVADILKHYEGRAFKLVVKFFSANEPMDKEEKARRKLEASQWSQKLNTEYEPNVKPDNQ